MEKQHLFNQELLKIDQYGNTGRVIEDRQIIDTGRSKIPEQNEEDIEKAEFEITENFYAFLTSNIVDKNKEKADKLLKTKYNDKINKK